jgi:hypothetical protein
MMENRLWCAECCRSKEVGDANADSDNLDLLARVSATATLNYDNDKHMGSDLPTGVVPSHDIDFHTPYHEDDDNPTSRNKGGCPKGSTDANKRDKAMQVLDARNWVCNEYAAEQDKNNGTAPAGLRRELIKNAKERFNIEDPKFDVSKQTIFNRIKADRLTVFGPGSPLVVLPMEVTLNTIIISAWEHNHPLTCGEVMHAANCLIEGTPFAAEIIRQRKAHTRRMTPSLAVAGGEGTAKGMQILLKAKWGKNLHACESTKLHLPFALENVQHIPTRPR